MKPIVPSFLFLDPMIRTDDPPMTLRISGTGANLGGVYFGMVIGSPFGSKSAKKVPNGPHAETVRVVNQEISPPHLSPSTDFCETPCAHFWDLKLTRCSGCKLLCLSPWEGWASEMLHLIPPEPISFPWPMPRRSSNPSFLPLSIACATPIH